ncbi:MAG: hypothetical protein R6U19_09170, partial [Bacteroidales bacterium]
MKMIADRIIKQLLRFIAFVLIQGLVLNQISISGYLTPLLYVMFILLLPFEMPRQIVLVLAFLLGYCVDLFSGTPGMHAAATLITAFFRPYLISTLSKRDEDEPEYRPTILSMGFRWIFSYTAIMVLLHHTLYFFIEAFRFSEFVQTMTRALVSSAVTIALVLVIQFLHVDELTYPVIAPEREPRVKGGVLESYLRLSEA